MLEGSRANHNNTTNRSCALLAGWMNCMKGRGHIR